MKKPWIVISIIIALVQPLFAERYIVRKNDSLWKIAKHEYCLTKNRDIDKAWRKIAAENCIKNPDKIYPGMKLIISRDRLEKVYQDVPSGYEYWKTVKARVTAYEPSWRCCGRFADGKTATGRNAWKADGCGVDPRAIPYCTMIKIPGIGFRKADDTGPAMKRSWRRGVYHVDVRFTYYHEARKWGNKQLELKLFRKVRTRLVRVEKMPLVNFLKEI